jgi:branched-chain amino acid transport system ATP-binding protein
LEVTEHDYVSVIGSNGAGKTTILCAISRMVMTKGSIHFCGQEISKLNPKGCVERGVIHCPEERLLFPDMTVLQNLRMGAYLRKDRQEINRDLDRVLNYFPVLSERINQLARTLSGGEQQMLTFGRAIMGRPRLLTLDEPSFGLAPMVVATLFDVIDMLNQEGVTVLLVEQNAALALERSRFAYVLEEGKVVDAGPSQEMLSKKSILEAYLGMA